MLYCVHSLSKKPTGKRLLFCWFFVFGLSYRFSGNEVTSKCNLRVNHVILLWPLFFFAFAGTLCLYNHNVYYYEQNRL